MEIARLKLYVPSSGWVLSRPACSAPLPAWVAGWSSFRSWRCFLHVDLRYAIGASLISVIATSSGAAAAYVREGYSNIRIGMFLEIATTIGALFGAYLATRVATSYIGVIFGLVLLYSAYLSVGAISPPTVLIRRRTTDGDGAAVRTALTRS